MGKNLIWQYYYPGKHGGIQDMHKQCVAKMKDYAEFCGAEHMFLTDAPIMSDNPYYEVFRIFTEDYDKYDTIVAVDADVFPVKGLTENIFDVPGNWCTRGDGGVSNWKHKRQDRIPIYDSIGGNGGVYKFTLEERQHMRKQLDKVFTATYKDRHGQDEYGMHILLHFSGMIGEQISEEWNRKPSDPHGSKFIHLQGQGSLAEKVQPVMEWFE